MTSRPHSLSRRLTLALGLAAVALIGGAQVFTEHQARTRLCGDFDRGLLQKAQTLATLVEQEHGRVEFDYVARLHPEFERDQEPDYLQVAMADGTVLLRSRHLAHDLEFSRSRGEPWYGDATLGDGRDVRYVVFPFHAELAPNAAAGEAPHELVLAVLRGVEPLRAALADLRLATVVAIAGAIAAGVLAFGALVRRFLAPVRAIAAQVAALDASTTTQRVALPDTPAELLPIVEQTNALLARLHAALQRERRFTGNVAHELRTPVAELRTLAEVARRWPDDRDAVEQFFGDVAAVSTRMGSILADLLLLARCQGGAERCAATAVPLQPLVQDGLERARRLGPARAVDVDVPAGAVVRSDPGKLAIVVDNLLGNALRHSPPDSRVRLTAGGDASRCWLVVENHAPQLRPADLEHLAEPFWRADAARSGDTGTGLGLAIVGALAALLDIRVEFSLRDATFVVRLELPAMPAPNPAPTREQAPAADGQAPGLPSTGAMP